MKKTLLATALALVSLSSFASSYYVVVPVPARTSSADSIKVTLNSYSLPSGLVGMPYAGFDLKTLLSVSGDPAYSGYGVKWSLVSGSLPEGLTLNANGTISGTPTASSTGAFQVKATYKTKGGVQSYQIVVANLTVALAAATPPEAIVGQAYSYDLKKLLSVTGDSAYNGSGVTWSVVADTLPVGLKLLADGTISGTPTAAGSGAVTARATYRTSKGEQTYQVVSLNIQVGLDAATLPAAKVGTAYGAFDFKNQLKVSGDPGYNASNVTFSATGVPDGLTLSNTGVLTGTPKTKNTAGTSFTIAASYKNTSGQQVYTLIVNGQALEVTQLALGETHTCAVTTTGGVMCWGANESFQLGNGTSTDSSTPVAAVGLSSGVRSVSVGSWHSCALTTAGGVKCWGWAGDGALGRGDQTDSAVPVDVPGLTSGVTSLSVRYESNCAVVSGNVKCWGAGRDGQMGNGAYDNQYSPVLVTGLSGATSVSTGQSHACALLSGGTVMCWGQGSTGALGDGTTTSKAVPVAVTGLTGVTKLEAGNWNTCVLTTSSRACWGDNRFGQYGDNTTTESYTPRFINDGARAIYGGDTHSCLVTSAGTARCYGNNYSGQLGNGKSGVWGTDTSDLSALGPVKSIVAGSTHTCAVLADNTVKCWGQNYDGRVGDGTTDDRLTPTAVSN